MTKHSNPAMERAVLGNILQEPGSYREIRRALTTADFFVVKHGWYYTAIDALDERDEPVTPLNVIAELERMGKQAEGDLSTDVYKLELDAAANNAEALDYAGQVQELAGKRRIMTNLTRWAKLADEHDPETAKATIRAELDKIRIGDPGRPPLKLLTGADVLTTEWPEPVWAVPELLPVGLTILAGKPKRGKSWLALQIAHAVTTGGHALGQHVERGPVLYLALEDNYRRMCERMKQQQWTIEAAALVEIMPMDQFTRDIDNLQNGGGERLAAQIERMGYRFVVVDTLSRSCYGDQNDVEKMTRALTPIHEMAHDKNCAIFMVDHHRKGFGADPDAVSDILGSTAKGAMADTCWGLYREPGKRGAKLAVVGRDIEERNLALAWDWDTGSWQVEGDADQIALTERRQEILDALESLGRCSAGAVAKAIEADRSNTYKRLQDMANAGLIVKVIEGRRIYYEPSL